MVDLQQEVMENFCKMQMKTLRKSAWIVDWGAWLPCDCVTIWAIGILSSTKLKKDKIIILDGREMSR